jgi:DNA-directed RNA polymerase subunit RPC12/RpoP
MNAQLSEKKPVPLSANDLLSNLEKSQLIECPYCGTDYGLGGSAADKNGNCAVTCGYCERIIFFKIDFIR